MIIFVDWQDTHYGLCDKKCLERFKEFLADPTVERPEGGPKEGVTFGCWWCGGDLTEGTQWFGSDDKIEL
jgi:hypothetical protein